ncbi:hypothetical protein AQJ91_44910 [Streptomyces dysideae]|uniref:Uncharacterized protein n=1 Tax=Streptomyces dysideae TaxID=909626 RepID=A0A101UQ43_9ACTN|nr:hypothetical protein AQJ91_44910 [Streptomyces dysideae]
MQDVDAAAGSAGRAALWRDGAAAAVRPGGRDRGRSGRGLRPVTAGARTTAVTAKPAATSMPAVATAASVALGQAPTVVVSRGGKR